MKEYEFKNAAAPDGAAANNYGYIESIYSGSGVDGKGLRVVVFFAGCNLRCPFCHNPETLYRAGGRTSVADTVRKILRYKTYLKRGGVTLSGGEPFLQKDFALALIRALSAEGVSTCIETNGHIIDEDLISAAESIICDVKNHESKDLRIYYDFLNACQRLNTEVELTNVLVPDRNDAKEDLEKLRMLYRKYCVVKGIRFLPFRKLCIEKYENMGIDFLYKNVPEADIEDIKRAENIVFSE